VVLVLLASLWVRPGSPGVQPAQLDPRDPAVVSVDERAPRLPADRAVGAASLVYGRCANSSCAPFLVMPDGTQYALPVRYAGSVVAALSPDGRWLGWADGHTVHLRDLLGTTERMYTGKNEPVGFRWSPNSRWLALGWSSSGDFTVVDLDRGQGAFLPGLPDLPFGITDNGEWLLFDVPNDGTYRRIDPRTGQGSTGKISPVLGRAGEYPIVPLLAPCSCSAVVPLFPSGPIDPYFSRGPVIALVEVDLTDGHVITRHDLPRDSGEWRPRAVLAGEGILLLRCYPDRTEVVQLDPVTGETRTVSRLPGGVEVILRGAGFP